MKRFIAVVSMVVVASVLTLSRAEAAPAQPSKPVKALVGRCLFPSARTLGAIISDEAKKVYLSQGYKDAFVGARVLVKKPVVTPLTKGNVTGLTSITPTAGTPAILRISANAGGTPLELGCNAEAEITTTVVLVDAAGVRSNGRSVTKVTVQGAFQ